MKFWHSTTNSIIFYLDKLEKVECESVQAMYRFTEGYENV